MGVTEYIFHCGPIRFFSLRLSLRPVGDDRICHLYRNNSKTRRRKKKRGKFGRSKYNSMQDREGCVPCSSSRNVHRLIIIILRLWSEEISFSSLRIALVFGFFLFVPHIFKTHNRETKEEKKCESVVDMQIEPKQKRTTSTSMTGEG